MATSNLGLAWIKGQFRYFKEFRYIGTSTKVKVLIRNKWEIVKEEDIRNFPD